MNRYEITLADGYGREVERLIVKANNLRLALGAAEQALTVRDSGHGQHVVSASVDLLGSLVGPDVDELPGGSVTCSWCGAVIGWEGERPTDCLRCGRDLVEAEALRTMHDAAIAQVAEDLRGLDLDAAERLAAAEDGSCGPMEAFSCEVDESAGLREITTRPDVARAERLAAELRREVEWQAARDEGRWPPSNLDETLHGLGDFDGGEEL